MAAKMKDIKRRINSVSSIRQITKAMELVSTSKMRRTRIKLETTRPYYNTVTDNISELVSVVKDVKTPLTKTREIKSTMHIIVSSDRGLAGGYSGNIARYAIENIDKENDLLITIGGKAYDFFNKKGYKIYKRCNMMEDIEFGDAKFISEMAIDAFKAGEVDSVKIFYTHFHSALVQKPMSLVLLPADKIESHKEVDTELITFEPSAEYMLDYLIEEFVKIAVYGALIESSASEQAARMQAMKNASESADDMIEELGMHYNRARQGSITQELTEIVSGAEALN